MENPFTISEHRLRAAILLSTDVSLHALEMGIRFFLQLLLKVIIGRERMPSGPFIMMDSHLQVHWARDVVLVGGELDRVNRLEERLAVCHRFHPGTGSVW